MAQRYTIQAVIYPGDESGYVAECQNLAVVTQGQTLDETVQNLREAIQLHLRGEDLAEMGLVSHPALLVTMEMEPVHAYCAVYQEPKSFISWKALVSSYTHRQAVTSS